MLYIVTPLSRPENLEQIAESLNKIYLRKSPCKIFWIIIMDKSLSKEDMNKVYHFTTNKPLFYTELSFFEKSFVGHSHRNFFINDIHSGFKVICKKNNIVESDWVYFLDDDTLLHPNFVEEIINRLDDTKSAIIFDQENKDGTIRLRADIDKVKVCHIDMGQYVVNLTKLPEDLRFKEDDYCADGIFIEELFNRVGPEQFIVVNKTLSTYNKLR